MARKSPSRPHIDDVDHISHGDAAKVRGTGSRDIPHRLNEAERELYVMATKKVGGRWGDGGGKRASVS